MKYRRFVIPLMVLGLWLSSPRTGAGEAEQGEKPVRLRWIIFTPVDPASPEETSPKFRPRLTAGPSATVLLDGKPFRGIGVNHFDCFLRTLHDGADTSYDAGFATLAAKGVPFVRFAATGFWPRDMNLYVENREEYFRRFDGVVRSAEKHGVGLVPSLFWYFTCVPDLVGEPMDQWANPRSKTQDWMRRYVGEVVTRYKSSPAIWMWEMGNEYSLAAITENEIPLAALWVFDYQRQPDYNITATNARSWQLEAIADANAVRRETRSVESKP